MLTISNLNKSFGKKLILDNININVEEGQILGVLGPNGMGKTTLLKTIVGILRPETGHIMLDGVEMAEAPTIKEKVGYVAEYQNYYQNFKIADMAQLYRLTYPHWDENRFQELRKIFNVPLEQKIKNISKGMRTQLAFLLNLPLKPKLLVLDEPTSGLDPVIRKQVLNLLVEQVANFNTTVIISSHNTSELERICDQVVFLKYGKIILHETMEELKENVRKVMVSFPGDLPSELTNDPDLLNIEQFNKIYTLVVKQGFISKLTQYNPTFLEEKEMNLEEIYIYQMGGANNGFKDLAN